MLLIVRFPYGKDEINITLLDEHLLSVAEFPQLNDASTELTELRMGINNPIASKGLRELASEEKKVCIIVSDHTRAMPTQKVVPLILHELEMGGCRMDNVYVLVAYGLHAPVSGGEIHELLGQKTMETVHVLEHNAEDEDHLSYLGKTALGTNLWVNQILAECDLIVGTGLIEPHFFAGYSGGRKAILPGVSGRDSIFQNHSFAMIGHPKARYGMLNGNPIHLDMVDAAKLAQLDYIVNVILDGNRLVKVFSGNPSLAHHKGTAFLDKWAKIRIPSKADIVIVSNGGYPMDRDLYQTVKGIATGRLCVKRRGVIIVLSECLDGIGGGHKGFYQIMAEAESPEQVLQRIKKEEPIKDQWQAQILVRVLKHANVIVVTEKLKPRLIEDMHMMPASNADEALDLAYKLTSKQPKIVAVPDGPYVIPCPPIYDA